MTVQPTHSSKVESWWYLAPDQKFDVFEAVDPSVMELPIYKALAKLYDNYNKVDIDKKNLNRFFFSQVNRILSMPRTQVRWRITPRRSRWRRWTSLRRSGPCNWDDDNDAGDDDDDDNDGDDDDQEDAMALIKAESQMIKNDWENNGKMLLLYFENPNLSEIKISWF